jgi:hypothetical protein
LVHQLAIGAAVLRGAVSRTVEIADETRRQEECWERRAAAIRAQMVDASVAAFVEDHRLPAAASVELPSVELDEDGIPIDVIGEDDTRPFRRADYLMRELERRLEAAERERVAGRIERRRELEASLAEVAAAHHGCVAKAASLWQSLSKAARAVRDARGVLVEYGKIDGAISSLAGMLDAARSS